MTGQVTSDSIPLAPTALPFDYKEPAHLLRGGRGFTRLRLVRIGLEGGGNRDGGGIRFDLRDIGGGGGIRRRKFHAIERYRVIVAIQPKLAIFANGHIPAQRVRNGRFFAACGERIITMNDNRLADAPQVAQVDNAIGLINAIAELGVFLAGRGGGDQTLQDLGERGEQSGIRFGIGFRNRSARTVFLGLAARRRERASRVFPNSPCYSNGERRIALVENTHESVKGIALGSRFFGGDETAIFVNDRRAVGIAKQRHVAVADTLAENGILDFAMPRFRAKATNGHKPTMFGVGDKANDSGPDGRVFRDFLLTVCYLHFLIPLFSGGFCLVAASFVRRSMGHGAEKSKTIRSANAFLLA